MNPISNILSPAVSAGPNASGLGADATKQQIEAVGVEFESVFLSMMIKEMRNSLENGGFFGEESSDTYGGMFDLFIGKHLAQAKPLGISEVLVEQYERMGSTLANESAETAADGTSEPISFTA